MDRVDIFSQPPKRLPNISRQRVASNLMALALDIGDDSSKGGLRVELVLWKRLVPVSSEVEVTCKVVVAAAEVVV